MSYNRDIAFKISCMEMKDRVDAANRCVETLLPDADPRRKKRISKKILTMCDGKDRSVKITQAQAEDLVIPHLQCLSKSCPLLCFWEPISRSINLFFEE